ncbi:MAG TPA: hypothetical protein DDX98_13870, partial [Bacteroidales bacterium]|nr:hypothetical protein [Bacteroidales bacterium]
RGTVHNDPMQKGLYDLIEWCNTRMKVDSIVEIGAFAGQSSVIFASLLSKVYVIDPFIGGYDNDDTASNALLKDRLAVKRAFKKNTIGYQNIKLYELYDVHAVDYFPLRSVHIVYIDADHLYDSLCKQISRWIPRIVSGGFISGHDYRLPEESIFPKQHASVVKAVNETVGCPDARFCDGSWVKQI